MIGSCTDDGCELLTSSLSYYAPSLDGIDMPQKGALKFDLTNPSEHIVSFAESTDFDFMCQDEVTYMFQTDDAYLAGQFDDDWDNWDYGGASYYFDWDDDYFEWDDEWWNGDDLMFHYDYFDSADDDWWNNFDWSYYSGGSYYFPYSNDEKSIKRQSSALSHRSRKFTRSPTEWKVDAVRDGENEQNSKKTTDAILENLKRKIMNINHNRKSKSKRWNQDMYSISPTAPKRRRSSGHHSAPTNRLRELTRPRVARMSERTKLIHFKRNDGKMKAKSLKDQEKVNMRKFSSIFKKMSMKMKEEGQKQRTKHLREGTELRHRFHSLNAVDFDDASYYSTFLNSKFNPSTFDGSGITQEYGGSEYRMLFNENAFIRSKDKQSPPCIDYSVGNRKLVTTGYKLYNAGDGSEVVLDMGYLIQKEVNGLIQEAYIDSWGTYAFWTYDYDSNTWFSDESWLVDGEEVEKIDYGTGDAQAYTLNIVNARLVEVSTFSVSLDELKDTPLLVNNYSPLGEYKISWNGENFVRTSEYRQQCVKYDYSSRGIEGSDGAYYWPYNRITVSTDNTITYDTCACLDTSTDPATVKTDGSAFDYTYEMMEVEVKLDTATNPQKFVPNSEIFPNLAYEGFLVSTETYSIYGQIDLDFEFVQELYGVNIMSYKKGDSLHQKSTGALGVIMADSVGSLNGYTCDGCKATISYNQYQCSDGTPYSVEYLLKGLILTQGDVVGFVDSDYVYPLWDHIPIVMKNSSQIFDISKDINITFPSQPTGTLAYYTNFVGKLSAPSAITLSSDWNDIIITGVANCSDDSSSDWVPIDYLSDLDVTVNNGGTGASILFFGSIESSYQYAMVQDTGSGGCDPDLLSVTVAVPSSSSYTCSSLPNITLKCIGYASKSDRVKVKLQRDNPVKFDFSYWRTNDEQVMMHPAAAGDAISIGWPWWVEEVMGELYPITGETTFTYRYFFPFYFAIPCPFLLSFSYFITLIYLFQFFSGFKIVGLNESLIL